MPSHNGSVTTEEWRCGLPQTTDSRQEGFMTLRYLEIFLALARTPNMRDAAAKLFISQAAVSSALRDFEAELGVSLFDRMAGASGSMTRGGCSKNGWPRCITSSRMCSRWWRVTNWRQDPHRRVHYAVRLRAAASAVQFQDAAPSGRNRM